MADIQGPVDLLVLAAQSTRDLGFADEVALRIRSWYLEAMASKLWVDYIRESDEDEGYYTAADYGAWSVNGQRQDARDLAQSGRPVVSIRHIKPQVDVLWGTQRQNKVDVRALPQGDEDEDDAKMMSLVMKYEAEQLKLQYHESEVFKGGLIRGMSAVELGIDWSGDTQQGRVYVERLVPGKNCIWDPWWDRRGRFDLDDARFVIRWDWAWVDDVVTQYPEKADEIQTAVAHLTQMIAPQQATTDGNPADAYGSTTSHPLEHPFGVNESFYDPAMHRIMVATGWWRTYRSKWLVYDKARGAQEVFPSHAEAKAFVDSDPDHLELIERRERVVRTATVLPGTGQTLEQDTDSPYDNDLEHYPIIPFIADKTGDVIEGLVRGLKDPQRIENKRISQAVELAQKYASMRRKAELNAVENPEALDVNDGKTIFVRPGKMNAIGWDTPDGLAESVRIHEVLSQDMTRMMREVGPSTDLLGQRGQASSGIAIARRQMQGQTTMFPYFDNLTLWRELVYARLARRIQQTYTLEKTLRLTGPLNEPVIVRINPEPFRGKDYDKDALKRLREEARLDPAKPHILRDASALKFDVVFAEAPSTPTARSALVEQLNNVVTAFPGIMPLVIDVLFKLLPDLPDRAELLGRVKAWQMAQGIGDFSKLFAMIETWLSQHGVDPTELLTLIQQALGGGPAPAPGGQPGLPAGAMPGAPPGMIPGPMAGRPVGAMPGEVGTTVAEPPPASVMATPQGALQG